MNIIDQVIDQDRHERIRNHNRIIYSSRDLLSTKNIKVNISGEFYLIKEGSDVIYSEFSGQIVERIPVGIIIAKLNNEIVLPLDLDKDIQNLQDKYLTDPYFLSRSPIDIDLSKHPFVNKLKEMGFNISKLE